MTKERQTGTALLGDSDLEKGQKVVILKILYTSKKKVGNYDLGLVMVSWWRGFNILWLNTKVFDIEGIF